MNKDKLKKILEQHTLWLKDSSTGKRANLSGADLKGSDLRGANLSGADLSGADLSGADLSGSTINDADLRGVYLNDANLRGALLSGTELNRADLRGADLSGSYLHGANLTSTKGIISFLAGRDLATYTPHNEFLQIGCEGHDIHYWLENAKDIGTGAGYRELEIEMYTSIIKALPRKDKS